MLYDKATIEVEAGAGGSGCVSFRREAHVPKGGPDGGDGGDGGDVALTAAAGLRDLAFFKQQRHHKGGRGVHGQGSQKDGAEGKTLELRVPCGTVVGDLRGKVLFDLREPGARVEIARGGAGGRGNRRFATSTRQTPRFAEQGLSGEHATLELRLKLLADIGLVGLPNAGKSSLLAALTRARPKIAAYPFTTIEPTLGTIEDSAGRQLVMADIPGLIEGASEGVGLGDEFLAHVERTQLLAQMVEVAPADQGSPEAAFETVREELAGYGAGLDQRPFLLVLSKIDLIPAAEVAGLVEQWRERLASEERVCRDGQGSSLVLACSSATGAGLDELTSHLFTHVAASEQPAADQQPMVEHAVYRPGSDSGFSVEPSDERVFRIVGPSIELLIARHDLTNADALAYIEEQLRSLGVVAALEAKGFEPGDEIEIGEVTFALYPGVPQNG